MTRRASPAPPGRPVMPWLLGGLVLALLMAVTVTGWHWFTQHFERRVEQIDDGYSAAARNNAFLAAGQFLTSLGLQVTSVPGRALLRDLPPPTDTLLVRGLGPMTLVRQRQLSDWIEAGGHLVCEAMEVTEGDNAPRATDFLAGFGVLLRDDGAPADEDDEATSNADPAPAAAKDINDPATAPAPPLRVTFNPTYHLEDRDGVADETWSTKGLVRGLHIRRGDGLLTVLADTGFMTNRDIGQPDHALFLAQLVVPSPRPGGHLWIIYDSAVPDLATLLWHAAPRALIAGGLLVLLWLWSVGRRLGPVQGEPVRAQRDLLIHLAAAGEFLWRHGRGQVHLLASRRRVEGAWLRRHPLLRGLTPPARTRWLARHTGIPDEAIMAALYRRSGASDPLADARTLQRLWLALTAPPAGGPAQPTDATL